MTEGTRDTICVRYRFDESPERVFDAWLDPRLVAKWLFSVPSREHGTAQIDARVGGRYSVIAGSGNEQRMLSSEYLVIDRPYRLEFTLGMPQLSEAVDHVAVETAPEGTGCVLTLTQEGVAAGYERDTESGWRAMFDVLASILR